MPTEKLNLREAEERCEKATEGWQEGTASNANVIRFDGFDVRPVGRINNPHNRALVIHARTDLPLALSLLREFAEAWDEAKIPPYAAAYATENRALNRLDALRARLETGGDDE